MTHSSSGADVGKPSNPKDALGIKKVPMSTVSGPVLAELGVAMLEGALKYGRHNYRVIGVRASVYYDAVSRHTQAWWEGEDLDPVSGVSHITKAIASLVVLRDAMIQGNWVDDRPPPSPPGWLESLNDKVAALLEKYPDPVAPYVNLAPAQEKPFVCPSRQPSTVPFMPQPVSAEDFAQEIKRRDQAWLAKNACDDARKEAKKLDENQTRA